MHNFILCWKNILSPEICNDIINVFEENLNKNPNIFQNDKKLFSNGNLSREDLSIALDVLDREDLVKTINHHLGNCLDEYVSIYGQYSPYEYTSEQIKIQRTMPYGGFHIWHHENAGGWELLLREFVWTIYLNDMPPNEAETEFLYQAVKVRPETGKLCIFPASGTHVHRGLTVYTQPKYILTGWFSRVMPDDYVLVKREELQNNGGYV